MSDMKYYISTSSHGGMMAVAKFDGAYVKVSDHEAVVARLCAEVEAYRKDAERYRWLSQRILSADFTMTDCVGLTFELPKGSRVSSNADKTIDAAIGASA